MIYNKPMMEVNEKREKVLVNCGDCTTPHLYQETRMQEF